MKDPCPTLPWQRCRAPRPEVKVRIPAGVDDGQRIRREGPRRGRSATAARPATSTSSCTSRPHPLFGRNGQARPHACASRSRSPRPRSAPSQGADARRQPVTVRIQAGTQPRQDRSGARAGASPTAGGEHRRPARHRRGRGAPRARRRRAQGASRRWPRRSTDDHGEPPVTAAGGDRRCRRPNRRALYVISVAAELAGVHPQTLRIYERKGLLEPARTAAAAAATATPTSSSCGASRSSPTRAEPGRRAADPRARGRAGAPERERLATSWPEAAAGTEAEERCTASTAATSSRSRRRWSGSGAVDRGPCRIKLITALSTLGHPSTR